MQPTGAPRRGTDTSAVASSPTDPAPHHQEPTLPTASPLTGKALLTTTEAAALTGLDPHFLRDNSRPDGTGEVPGRKVASMWVFPRWWVAWLLLPPAAWLPELAALWSALTAAPLAVAEVITGTPS
jgi:hypothetical protein